MQLTLLYDAECSLCEGAVQWIAARDRRKRFCFVPLQCEPACGMDSMVVRCGEREYRQSSAVLRAARGLGLPWSMLWLLMVVPRRFRDGWYRYVALRRSATRPPVAAGENSA